MTRKTRKPARRTKRNVSTKTKVKRTLKRLATPENIISLLTGVVVPLVIAFIDSRNPPIIIED